MRREPGPWGVELENRNLLADPDEHHAGRASAAAAAGFLSEPRGAFEADPVCLCVCVWVCFLGVVCTATAFSF